MRTLPAGLAPTPTQAPSQHPTPPTASAHHTDDDLAAALFATWSGDPALVVSSPPGAGKTRLVTHLADQLHHRAGLTIALAAQTRTQATDLTTRLAALTPHLGLLAASKTPRPTWLPAAATWLPGTAATRNFTGIVIATSARWAWTQPRDFHADVLLVDEAWQLTFADAGSLGALAEQVVMVGDPGQIDPVVTGATTRWEHFPAGPHQPAPAALTHRYPEHVTQQRLRRTWRLGPATTDLVQPTLYPDLPFTSARPHSALHHDGQALPELATIEVPLTGRADPRLAAVAADRARALLGTTLTETNPATGQATTRPTAPSDVAVIAPHVEQVAAIAAHLADVPDVLVATANQAQGLERHAVVAAHPLAGYRAAPSYATDTGRLCVTLSRHRSHLSLLTDPRQPRCPGPSPAARGQPRRRGPRRRPARAHGRAMTTTLVGTDTSKARLRRSTAPTQEHFVTAPTAREHLKAAVAAHERTGFHALAADPTPSWVDAVVRDLRAGRVPDDVEPQELQAAGIDASTPTKWEATRARAWPLFLEELQWWIETHAGANLPQNATSRDVDGAPYPLGRRAHQIRNDYRAGKLAPERVDELKQLPGWAWDPRTAQWQETLQQVQDHHRRHHTLEGLDEPLQRWVARQRQAQLTDDQRAQLEAIPGALVDRRRRAGAFVVAARAWLQAQPEDSTLANLPSSATVQLRPRTDVDLGAPDDEGLITYPVGKRATFYRRRFHGLETTSETATPLHPDDVRAIEELPGWSWELDPIKSANRRRSGVRP